MFNITDQEIWEETIRDLETTDPLLGGENGHLTQASQQLANRTAWLKAVYGPLSQTVSNLGESFAALGGSASNRFKAADAQNDNEVITKRQLIHLPQSVGVGVSPSGLLDNGKGIAFGDSDTGIRQKDDGVLEMIANDQVIATVSATQFMFSKQPVSNGHNILTAESGLAIHVTGGSETDVTTSPVVHLSRQFTATERKILVCGQLTWDTQSPTATDLISDIELFDITGGVTVAVSSVQKSTSERTASFENSMAPSMSFDVLTIGRTYEIRLRCWKGQPEGPMIPRNMSLSAIMI